MILSVVLIVVLGATATVLGSTLLRSAHADIPTGAGDNLRTGWYPDQTRLSPDLVSGGTFGQLFNTRVDGQVYAQPLVAQGVVFIATETNNIYGLNPVTGSQIWTRNLGVPFNPADVTCSDLTPSVGITATPVIDTATHIAYFTEKSYLSGTSGPAVWYIHAVDVTSGVEQSGFPVRIQGTATNDPTHTFDATRQMQRPGLLLLNGVIYASFGGHCDRKPYEGWIIGISTSGHITTLWTDEAGQPEKNNLLGPGGGIWMPGGGLVSDGPGQIIFSSGNGAVPAMPSAGSSAATQPLGQTVTRLTVQSNGSLKATDFFAPYDVALLNNTDSDVGSGAPIELPTPYFGTKTYPHLLIQVGKQGYVYLLNADNLGGRGEGPNNSDAVIDRIGPNGGVWGKPAVWPGDGGYVYITTAEGGGGSGKLKAYHYGLDGTGKPTLSFVASTFDTFGYSSSSPVVTSSGTTSGSALVWVVWSPDGTGVGSQLRAYDPVPVNGVLHLRYSAPIGTASKFNSPGLDNNHVYVGTRDGHVLGFGSPVNSPLSGTALNLGTVIVGKNATATLTLTANTTITVTALKTDNSMFTIGKAAPALPVTLSAGQTLPVPIAFSPTAVGLTAANLTATTSIGALKFGLSGTGESATGVITVSPSPISFGGVAAGTAPVTASTTFMNAGATPITITGLGVPKAPFSASGLPAIKSTLAPGASVTVTLAFAPTAIGTYIDMLSVKTTGGEADVPMSGNAGAPGKLTISPLAINVGNVSIGANAVATFTVSNTGGSPLTITRSKFPVAGVGFTPYTTLPEGTVIPPATSLVEKVLFSPSVLGNASDSWSINSDDNSGVQTVTFTGTGIARVTNSTLPSLYIGDLSLVQPTSGSIVATIPVTLGQASSSTVTVKYTTKDGAATVAAGDYNAAAGTLTFNPGETSKTISVTVNGRLAYGPITTFTVNIASPQNAVLGNASGKVRLERASGLYVLSIGDTSIQASSTGTVSATFPLSLSAAPVPGDTVTVTVTTADGTGKAGTDYVGLPATTVTFGPGETTAKVVVPVKLATAGAGNKTFLVNLSAASANATIADTQAVGTIVNGGAAPPPSAYVSDVTLVQRTSGTVSANFAVTLGSSSTVPIVVTYATHDGTATVTNGMYASANGSVTFAPGETSKIVAVQVNAAIMHGSDTYFYLNLVHASNAVLGNAAGRALLINPLGRYTLSLADASVVQNAQAQAVVQVAVSLNAAVTTGQSVTVQISTTDGTAVAGSTKDYVAVPLTTFTFNPGQQTILVPIFINANTATTPLKTFTLTAVNPSSNVLIADSSATITIVSHA